MIYVNQDQLDQVEYIIEQSSKGFHVLFDNDLIRRVYSKGGPAQDDEAEKHIESIIMQPTLLSKKAYLERLDSETLERVIRTYFAIVENNMFEGIKYHQ